MSRPTLMSRAVLVILPVIMVAAGCQNQTDPNATNSPPASAATTPAASPTPSGSPSPSARPSVKPVNNFDAITVTGERGKEPKVEIKGPYAVDETRVKVLTPGNGTTVPENAPVTVNYYGVNGRTGKKFDDSWSRKQTVTFPLDQVVPGFKKGLEKQKAGSRVLIAMPGKDGYDASGGNPQAGIERGDTLVFVVDIEDTLLDRPEGNPVTPASGLPSVTGGTDTPTITVPKADPPAELKVQPLIAGNGKEVAAGELVHLRYRGVLWADGSVIDDNYGKPAEQTLLSNRLIEGFRNGLVGQKVGSRVMLVIPPGQAYPEGNEQPKVPKGATLVYVVDILFAQQAPQGPR